MNEKYKHLIYENQTDEEKVKQECYDYALRYNSVGTNDFELDYSIALLLEEGKMLFDLVAKTFGKQLWNNGSWQTEHCERNCPFGEMCKKNKLQIDGEYYCYGNIYMKNITENRLISLLNEQHICIVNANNEVIVDLNSSFGDFGEREKFANFFSEMYWYIEWFGDSRGGKQVVGETILDLLLHNG